MSPSRTIERATDAFRSFASFENFARSESFLISLDNVPPQARNTPIQPTPPVYFACLNKQDNRVTILAYWEVTLIES